MDNLEQRLRADAERIDANISSELDQRIEASLHAITPDRPARSHRSHGWFTWLAGGLVGAAAVAVVALIIPRGDQLPAQVETVDTLQPQVTLPVLDLDSEADGLVDPLSQELENLQADLRRAEKLLREDIGF